MNYLNLLLDKKRNQETNLQKKLNLLHGLVNNK